MPDAPAYSESNTPGHDRVAQLKNACLFPTPAKKPAPRGRDFYFNAAENAMELVSEPSPHRPTLQAAGKADPTSGSKYVPKEQRIYEAIKLPGYETLAASDKSFVKLEANRKLEDERSKRRNAKFI